VAITHTMKNYTKGWDGKEKLNWGLRSWIFGHHINDGRQSFII